MKLFSLHKALQVRREKETKRLTVSVKTIARVHVGVLDHVSAPDYVAITQAVINFLLFSGLLRDDFKEMKVAKETVEAEMEMTSEQISTT